MNSQQIDAILKRRSGRSYRGVFACDELLSYDYDALGGDALFVVNTDKSDKPGQHWVALHLCPNGRGYYFDSFAGKPNELIRKFLTKHCGDYWRYNKFVFQSVMSVACGAFVIHWILVMQKFNYDPLKMATMYYNDTLLNEHLVLKFLHRL